MTSPRLARFLVSTLVVTAAAEAHAQQPLVGPLRDQRVVEGCSWSASSADVGPGFMFLAEYDQSLIVMNIDGTDVRLTLDPRSAPGYPSRVGDRVTKVYTAGSIRVEATYETTWVCPPNAEGGCEVTRFDVTFVVKRDGRTETVHAIGDVGC
jgi:hypothetical protein